MKIQMDRQYVTKLL